jgi:oligoendopeptidase F
MNTQIVMTSEPAPNHPNPLDASAQQQRRDSQVREQAIEALVKEIHIDVEQIRQLYDAEHARLAAQAKIKTYVSLIAMRLVRESLQQESSRLQ